MRTRSALLPLAVAAGLAAGASPASAADGPSAHAAGGDPPPIVPSLIQTRITRTENALERLTQYVDDQDSASVVRVGKVIRRQTSAAWRGAKYYLRTAPPPVADDARVQPKKRSLKGDAVLPVVADQYTSAIAVFGLVHDVSSQAIELTDGAHGNTLVGLSKTQFWALDKRDAMVQDAKAFEPPPDPEDVDEPADAARSLKAATSGARKLMQDDAIVGFSTLMPEVTQGLDDEQQHINGLQSDATNLSVKAKSILRQAEVQSILTENTINTIWPPVPADD